MNIGLLFKGPNQARLAWYCLCDVVLALLIACLLVGSNIVHVFIASLVILWIFPVFFRLKEELYFMLLWKVCLKKSAEEKIMDMFSQRHLPYVEMNGATGYEAYCEALAGQDVSERAKSDAAMLRGFFEGRLSGRSNREKRYYQAAIDETFARYLRTRQY